MSEKPKMSKISVELDATSEDLLRELPYGKRSYTIRKAIEAYLENGDHRLRELMSDFNTVADKLRKEGYEIQLQKKLRRREIKR